MKFLVPLILLLSACATSGQDTGQGAINQNVRGGIFSSYVGGPGGPTGSTRIKGTADGKEIDLEISSGAPFIIAFGEIESNTDVSTAGQSQDQVGATTSTSTEPKLDAQLTK